MNTNHDTPLLGTSGHLKNALSVGSGRLAAQALNLLVIPFILQFISPSDYGAFTLLQTSSMIYGVVVSLGISTVFLARFSTAEAKENGVRSLLGACISQQAIFGGVLLVIGLYFAAPVSRMLVGTLSPDVFIYLLLSEYFTNHLLVFARWQVLTKRHWQVSVTAVLRAAVFLLLSFILVGSKQMGISGLALADAIAELLVLLLNIGFSWGKFSIGFSREDVKAVIRLGLPAAPDTIFFWLIISMPLYFLRQGGQAGMAGAFSLAWRICAPVDVLGNSLASGAARQFLESESSKLAQNLHRLYRNSLWILLLSLVSLNLLGTEFLRWFFSSEYQGAAVLLPFISLGYFFLSLYYFEWFGISGSQRTAGLSLSSGVGVMAGLILPVLSGFNPTGIASVTSFALSFLAMWLTARVVRPGLRFGKTWQLIGGGGFMTIMVLILNRLPVQNVIHALIIIIFLLGMCGIVCLTELWMRVRERRSELGGRYRWHDLPNYRVIDNLINQPRRILDIGCSEGFFLRDVPADLRVGIDVDFDRLLAGHKEVPGVFFVYADALALPFKREIFDTITMIGTLPYICKPISVLQQAERALSPGGILALSTVSDYWVYRVINLNGWRHGVVYTNQVELCNWLDKANLRVATFFEKGWLLSPLLSIFFTVPSVFDRFFLHSASVVGPAGRRAREMTNPLFYWEYNRGFGRGYQLFARVQKK